VALRVRVDRERVERRARLAGGAIEPGLAARATRVVAGRRGAENGARALVDVREQDTLDARQQPEREQQRREPSAGDAHRARRL
jgi:hypothetical protein